MVRHWTISDHFGSCPTKNQFAQVKCLDKIITKTVISVNVSD